MSAFRLFILFCLSATLTKAAVITSTTTGGTWSTTSTWIGGIVPTASDDIVIDGPVTLGSALTVASGRTLTVNASKTLTVNGVITNSGTITFQAGGNNTIIINSGSNSNNFTNTGTFNCGTGTIEIKGAGGQRPISGTFVFNNVTLDNVNQMNFGANATINGTIRLNNGAFITTHPTYGANSLMEVNSSYGTNLTNRYLWGGTEATMPANISFLTGTTNSFQQTYSIKKNLTIASGASVSFANSCVTFKTTFTGITNYGTLNIGSVNIESGLTWNVDANYTMSGLSIQNNAVVNCNSYTLTMNFSYSGDCNGPYIIYTAGNGQFNAGTGTIVVTSSANTGFNSNITLNNLVAAGGTITTSSNVITINGNVTVNTGANFNYGNAITTGTIVYGSSASVTNNGGNTANITNTTNVPTAPTPVAVDNTLTALANSTSGGGSFSTGLKLTSPNSYGLSSNMTINGSRKVLYIYAPAEFTTNGYTLTADSVYLMGKLTISNAGGLSGFLGTTKIVIASGSIINYVGASGTQTITAASYGNLYLSGAAAKTITGTYTISGNFIVAGTTPTLISNPSFTFNGAAQSIAGLPYNAPTFSGSGNKTLLDTTKVTGVVTISGTANLISNGLLTLTSTSGGTASLGALTGSATITGNINYERYIPAGRLWRFIGWPISGTTVANTWQKQVYITGTGTGGGALGTTNSNGFDWTSTNETSVYYYNETSSAAMNSKWTGIPNATTSISATRGYRVFIRGDRSQGTVLLNGSAYTPQAVTLKGSGVPNKGDIPVSLTCSNGCGSGDGWNFIANPYPSAINWNNTSWVSARSGSISGTVHVYNPASNNYGSWNATGGSVNGGSNIIASGQAFWIKTTGNSTLTFTESYKATNTVGGLFGKSDNELPNNLKIQLGDSSKVFDESVVYMYANATNDMDGDLDALKAGTGNATVSTYTAINSNKLVFNAIAELSNGASDTIFIYAPLANANYNYRLSFQGITSFVDESTQLMLLDAYTGGMIDLKSNSTYDFATTKNSATTYAANRFTLVISTGATTPLPVSLLSFSGKKDNNTVVLNWQTASERMNERFDIQRSTDGISFTTIGSEKGAINSIKLNRYSFIDEAPEKGINYYRLKQVNTDNTFVFSPVIGLNFNINNTESKAVVYPTQATNNLTLELYNSTPTHVNIQIVNTFGQQISSFSIDADMSNYILPIDVSNFKPGIYFLSIKDINGKEQTVKFLKEAQ